jgi:hypothetical protein
MTGGSSQGASGFDKGVVMTRRIWLSVFVLSLATVHAYAQPAPVAPAGVPKPVAQPGLPAQNVAPLPPEAEQPPQPPPPPPGEPGQSTPRPTRPAAAPPVPIPPPGPRQSVNIRIDLTISDEGGPAAPVKKLVSMTVADYEFGQIRSNATIAGIGEVPLHVDARPTTTPDGKIRVQLTINYNLTEGSGVRTPVKENAVNPWKTEIREQLGVILENGKPLIVSQSADPIGDRRVTVEVKATILR